MQTVAEDRFADGVEAAEALDVHVHQLARALALVARDWTARGNAQARGAVARSHQQGRVGRSDSATQRRSASVAAGRLS